MTNDDEPNDNNTGGDVGGKTNGERITVGPIISSTAVAIGDGVTAKATIYQMPALEPVLHQLRAPVGDSVGRDQEIDQLVQALSKAASGGMEPATGGIRGMGGIGKTELAYDVDSTPDTGYTIAFPTPTCCLVLNTANHTIGPSLTEAEDDRRHHFVFCLSSLV